MKSVDISDPEFKYDPEDPEGFRSGRFQGGFGAQLTGTSVYEIPPGQALCPYHYEIGEEEWLLVLAGTATVRTPEGKEEVGLQRLVFFPRGPDGAHQILNESGEPLRVLMWSNSLLPTGTVYPDSDKIAIWTGGADDGIFRRGTKVEYFDGET